MGVKIKDILDFSEWKNQALELCFRNFIIKELPDLEGGEVRQGHLDGRNSISNE